jgi:hypothetical protein
MLLAVEPHLEALAALSAELPRTSRAISIRKRRPSNACAHPVIRLRKISARERRRCPSSMSFHRASVSMPTTTA